MVGRAVFVVVRRDPEAGIACGLVVHWRGA
jgi:hypothetical protein